jgi:hypothetical protein
MQVSNRAAIWILAPLLGLLLLMFVVEVKDRSNVSLQSNTTAISSPARAPLPVAASSSQDMRAKIDYYFLDLIEKSANDSMVMRLKSWPTKEDIELQIGPPTELTVAKLSDTPAQYRTEFDPATSATWKGADYTIFCEFSHKDGKLFGLSMNGPVGVSYSDIGRPWGKFHSHSH